MGYKFILNQLSYFNEKQGSFPVNYRDSLVLSHF